MFKINDNYLKLPGSYLFSTIAKKVAAYKEANPEKKDQIISLGIGDVTLPLAPAVIARLHSAVDEMAVKETFKGYAPDLGYEFLRSAIAQHDYKARGVEIAIDEIFISDGAKSDSGNIGDIFSVDNRIAVCDPVYPVYVDTNVMAGRAGDYNQATERFSNVIYMPCTEENGFAPELPEETPDIIYLCFPNNPTGAVYPKEILEQIAQIAREKELIIFSDEIYDRLVMDGYQHTSIASLAPDVFCVTFSGLSKSHMIAGFRIGWMILSGAKERAKGYIEGIKMLSSMRLCSNVPAQAIVQTALGGYQSVAEYVKPGGRVYEQRECIYNALKDIPGISVVKPHAAFYIFPKLDVEKFNITDDEQFALDFLHEKQVLLVPGKGFNWGAPDHFRVVYLPNTRQLETASQKLKEFLSTYRQGR